MHTRTPSAYALNGQQSVADGYRLGKSTVNTILHETCKAPLLLTMGGTGIFLYARDLWTESISSSKLLLTEEVIISIIKSTTRSSSWQR